MSLNWLRLFRRSMERRATPKAEAFKVMQIVQCDPVQIALRDQCP